MRFNKMNTVVNSLTGIQNEGKDKNLIKNSKERMRR